jgi:hypothetical protein
MELDLVLFESTAADPGWDERRLRGLLPRGIGWDVPFYREILTGAKLQPGGTFETYKKALRPFRWEFLAAVYRAAVADCRTRGLPCVLVLIPRVGKPAEPTDRQRLLALAKDAGFAQVVDLSDAYDGLDPKDLAISADDYHPNTDGHARLARRLVEELSRLPELRRRTTRANEEAELR